MSAARARAGVARIVVAPTWPWWPVVASLARIEGARLVRHPLFLAAALLVTIFSVTFADATDIGGRYLVLLGPTMLPLAVATLMLANVAALRSRRSGTDELYVSASAPVAARTLAHLLALAWPAFASAMLVAVAYVAFQAWEGLVVDASGARRTPGPIELLQGPAAVAAMGALGVALGRWLPHPAAGALTGLGLLVYGLPYTLWNFDGAESWFLPLVNPGRTASNHWSWPCSTDQETVCALDVILIGSLRWHVAYLLAAAVLLGAVALLRHRSAAGARVLAVIALIAVATTGIGQIP